MNRSLPSPDPDRRLARPRVETRRAPCRSAFSLVELLIVVVLMGIVAGMVVSRFDPATADQLDQVAAILVSDLDYARALAVANNSKYAIQFDVASNVYHLQHTGTNAALDALPSSAYLRNGVDAFNKPRQTADVAGLLGMGPTVRLHQVQAHLNQVQAQSDQSAVTAIEFSALGGTTVGSGVEIRLSCGDGAERRYISVKVDNVVGLASVGEVFATAP